MWSNKFVNRYKLCNDLKHLSNPNNSNYNKLAHQGVPKLGTLSPQIDTLLNATRNSNEVKIFSWNINSIGKLKINMIKNIVLNHQAHVFVLQEPRGAASCPIM